VAVILGSLKKLARALSADEFAIDEKPVEIVDVAELTREATREIPAEVDADANGAPASPPAVIERISPDLVSSLSEILAEHGRLTRLAQELKPAGPTGDEFGRFAREAIPFLDALDRVVELAKKHPHSEEMSGWLRSVEALYERVLELFDEYGLVVMDCKGQKVDFNLHDVIEYRRTADHPHNTVIEEIRKGIRFRGRVIRDAKVIVACNDEAAPGQAAIVTGRS
jgi:molecular chaperone GrpE